MSSRISFWKIASICHLWCYRINKKKKHFEERNTSCRKNSFPQKFLEPEPRPDFIPSHLPRQDPRMGNPNPRFGHPYAKYFSLFTTQKLSWQTCHPSKGKNVNKNEPAYTQPHWTRKLLKEIYMSNKQCIHEEINKQGKGVKKTCILCDNVFLHHTEKELQIFITLKLKYIKFHKYRTRV